MHQYEEQELVQHIYSALAEQNESLIDKYWQQYINQYQLTDELLASKWQFDFSKKNFENIIEEAEQLEQDMSLKYPQACLIYLECYIALEQPELALSIYYHQTVTANYHWQLLLSKIQRSIDAQQKTYSEQLSIFNHLNRDEQLILLEKLLQSHSRFYISSVREIVEDGHGDVIITWALLYLQQANDTDAIVYKRNQTIHIVCPSELPTIELSQVYQVNQQILNYIIKHKPHLIDIAKFITVNLFNCYYPKYTENYSIEEFAKGIEAYYNYVVLGVDLDVSEPINQLIINSIK